MLCIITSSLQQLNVLFNGRIWRKRNSWYMSAYLAQRNPHVKVLMRPARGAKVKWTTHPQIKWRQAAPLCFGPSSSVLEYCGVRIEENVWHLCHAVSNHHPKELQHCYVVFVSNDHRTVPLWRQKAGHEEEKLVIWDYHVLFLYTPDDRCLVYDLDSELPFPTYFHKYVTETFRTDHILKPDYFRYFRVVPAPVFLQHFASDRRHMKRLDGAWLKAPPDYPPITTPSCSHNLEEFINMDPTKGHGEVMNLTQLVRKFYQQT